jgi:CBS domain-containing protein
VILSLSKAKEAAMKAHEVMTRNVITVRPDTPVQEIAALMVDNHISGVPVVTQDERIVGIVSESDLLHRAEVGTERRRKWWFRVFGDSRQLAQDFAKAHGRQAHEVMTRYVVSVSEDAELRDVADILDNRRIKRVPVVDGHRVVGIISRGDLVRALSRAPAPAPAPKLDNATLHKSLHSRISATSWISPGYFNVTVNEGVVNVWGFVESEEQRRGLRALIEETEGVVRVEDNLSIGIPFQGI